jgi:hypothetical protein
MLRSVRLFMKWLVIRSLPVRTFTFVCRTVSSVERAAYLQQNGKYITRILFDAVDTGGRTWKAQAVRDVCAFCPNVTHIEVPKNVPIAAFDELVRKLPALYSVSFTANAYGEAGFRTVVEGCAQLTSIAVSQPGSQEWSHLLPLLPQNLLHLNLGGAAIPPEAIDALTTRCPLLRTLIIAEACGNLFSDALVLRIAANCPFLENVHISNGDYQQGTGICALGQGGCLQSLKIYANLQSAGPSTAYYACICTILSLNPNLQTLATPADTELLVRIAVYARQLQHLSVREGRLYGHNSADAGMIAVAVGCTQLRTLHVAFFVDNRLLTILAAHCPHLVAFAAKFGAQVSDAGVCALAQGCGQLRELSSVSSYFTYRITSYIAFPITIIGVNALAKHCPHLRELHVHRSVVASVVNRAGADTVVIGKMHVTVHSYGAA